MDDDEDFTEEEGDEYEAEEEWAVATEYRELPSGLSFASIVWNFLTFGSDCVQAFDKLIRNFRADLEIRDAKKRHANEFRSSVEAGIESLG